jgi:hypothetical protein
LPKFKTPFDGEASWKPAVLPAPERTSGAGVALPPCGVQSTSFGPGVSVTDAVFVDESSAGGVNVTLKLDWPGLLLDPAAIEEGDSAGDDGVNSAALVPPIESVGDAGALPVLSTVKESCSGAVDVAVVNAESCPNVSTDPLTVTVSGTSMAERPDDGAGVSTSVSDSTVPGTAVCVTALACTLTDAVAWLADAIGLFTVPTTNGDEEPAWRVAVYGSELAVLLLTVMTAEGGWLVPQLTRPGSGVVTVATKPDPDAVPVRPICVALGVPPLQTAPATERPALLVDVPTTDGVNVACALVYDPLAGTVKLDAEIAKSVSDGCVTVTFASELPVFWIVRSTGGAAAPSVALAQLALTGVSVAPCGVIDTGISTWLFGAGAFAVTVSVAVMACAAVAVEGTGAAST